MIQIEDCAEMHGWWFLVLFAMMPQIVKYQSNTKHAILWYVLDVCDWCFIHTCTYTKTVCVCGRMQIALLSYVIVYWFDDFSQSNFSKNKQPNSFLCCIKVPHIYKHIEPIAVAQ